MKTSLSIVLFLFNFFYVAPLEAMQEMLEFPARTNVTTHNPLIQGNAEEFDLEAETHKYSLIEMPDFGESNKLDKLLYMVELKMRGSWERDEKQALRLLRGIVNKLVPFFSLAAGFSYFQPACNASLYFPIPAGNDFLCYTFGISTVITYGGLATWAGFRLTNRMRYPSFEDNIMEKQNASNAYPFLKHLISNFSGALASIPGAYFVYNYNSIKWLVLPAIIVDYILKTEGYYIFFEKINHTFRKDKNETNKNLVLRERLKNVLVVEIYNLIANNQCDDEEIRSRGLQSIRNVLIHSDSETNDPPETRYGKVTSNVRKFCQFIGLIFPLGTEIFRIQLTNSALGYVFDSPYIRVPLACLISIPGFSLNVLANTHISGALFDKIYRSYYHPTKKTPSFMGYFFPKINSFIYGISITMAILSTTGEAFVAADTASNSGFSSLTYMLPMLIVINNSLFHSFALCNLCQDISMEAIVRLSTGMMALGVNITRAYEFAFDSIDQINFTNWVNGAQLESREDTLVTLPPDNI